MSYPVFDIRKESGQIMTKRNVMIEFCAVIQVTFLRYGNKHSDTNDSIGLAALDMTYQLVVKITMWHY